MFGDHFRLKKYEEWQKEKKQRLKEIQNRCSANKVVGRLLHATPFAEAGDGPIWVGQKPRALYPRHPSPNFYFIWVQLRIEPLNWTFHLELLELVLGKRLLHIEKAFLDVHHGALLGADSQLLGVTEFLAFHTDAVTLHWVAMDPQ